MTLYYLILLIELTCFRFDLTFLFLSIDINTMNYIVILINKYSQKLQIEISGISFA